MKFKINRDHFAAGLAQVLGVVGSRTSMPILSNVHIEAEGDSISLTTTNLDLGIRCRIKASVTSGGTITLPVKKLTDIVKRLPSTDTTVELSGQNRVKVTSGASQFQIMGIPSDTFPALPVFPDQNSFILPQAELASMLRKVSYAQSTDENRFILLGVYFNFSEGKLTLVATDGRRLATAGRSLEAAATQTGSLILPARTVMELQRILGDDGEVRIAFNDRQVSFRVQISKADSALTDQIHLVSKVVEGSYPNYRQVIPKDSKHVVSMNRETLLECVQRAALMTSDKNTSVKLTIGQSKLIITASSPEYGESHEELALENAFDSPPVQIAFNPGYLLDPLKALTDDVIRFDFKDDMSPGVIRNAEDFLCVVMPQRLG